jgi:hypothetical protein
MRTDRRQTLEPHNVGVLRHMAFLSAVGVPVTLEVPGGLQPAKFIGDSSHGYTVTSRDCLTAHDVTERWINCSLSRETRVSHGAGNEMWRRVHGCRRFGGLLSPSSLYEVLGNI